MNDVQFKGLLDFLKKRGFNVGRDPYQYAYVKAMADGVPDIHEEPKFQSEMSVFMDAEAGTGKTTLATLVGAFCVELGLLDGILYVRTEVDVDSGSAKDRGALPGSDQDKTLPYQTAFIEALDEYRQGCWEVWRQPEFKRNPKAIATHPGHFRGVTKKRLFVIMDECQNWTMNQLQTTYTRFCQNCVVISIGHSGQCDLPAKIQGRIAGHLPFAVFTLHHQKAGAWTGNLVTNYRGDFARWSDKVGITIQELLSKESDKDG